MCVLSAVCVLCSELSCPPEIPLLIYIVKRIDAAVSEEEAKSAGGCARQENASAKLM